MSSSTPSGPSRFHGLLMNLVALAVVALVVGITVHLGTSGGPAPRTRCAARRARRC